MSVLAVVSKAVFEKQARRGGALLAPGDVWPTDRYASANPALAPLASGGSLLLATVRPGDRLWLVAILTRPTFDRAAEAWTSPANTVPITDITSLVPTLRFASGKGITVAPGKLGMSLQTPRELTAADVAAIEALLPAAVPAPPADAALLARLPAEARAAIARAIAASPQTQYPHVQKAFAAVAFPMPANLAAPVYPLASTLDDAQRALAELSCAYPFNVYPYALPGPIVTRKRWLGIAPPSVLEATRVGGEPLWRALQLAGDHGAGADLAAQAAILDALPTLVALDALAELMLVNDMGYRVSASMLLLHVDLRAVRELGSEAAAWGVAMANRLIAGEHAPHPMLALIVFLALVRGGVPIAPRWEVLFPNGFGVRDEHLVECARALPADRRDAVLIAQIARSLSDRAVLQLLAESPSAEVTRALLAHQEVHSRRWQWLVDELRALGERHPVIAGALDAVLAAAPKPLGLVIASRRRVSDVGELSPLEREQLRIAGSRYDGRDLDAAARLTPLVDEGDPGLAFLELRAIADGTGQPAFDVLTYMADSGTIFRAGSTTVVGDIVQGGVILLAKDDALRTAIQTAADAPRPRDPRAAPAKPSRSSRAKRKPAAKKPAGKPARKR